MPDGSTFRGTSTRASRVVTGDRTSVRACRTLVAPSREAEIPEELAQHLEDRWRELVATARRLKRRHTSHRTEFDGARLEALLGTLRQAHWHETPPPGPSRAFSFDSVLIDLRHAIRALRATPSFTLGALLVLALGTGATTAIFSVVDAVALRPLPFPDPDRIVARGGARGPAVAALETQRPGPASSRWGDARRETSRSRRPRKNRTAELPGLGWRAACLRVDRGHRGHRRVHASTVRTSSPKSSSATA